MDKERFSKERLEADGIAADKALHILDVCTDLTPSDFTAIQAAIAGEGRLVTTEDCEKIHAWLDAKLEWSLRDEKIRFGPQVGQDQGGE